ncbi:MAG: polyamine aminopropyltransferase [Candidatus Omnitrophica bacterium]|nr:polyamine aminopropyltransferase [Candidatus Omnitrophota bacterium]
MKDHVSLNKKEWFIETPLPGSRRYKLDAFQIEKNIFRGKTPFQDVHVFESKGFGRVLSLDGIIQFTQSDEFIYHEVIAHVPLFSHPNPKRFLVIGGGDGGVLREATRHPLKEIYHVELDREIVEICRKYLPSLSRGAFKDKRVKLCFEDGMNFVKQYKDYFDVIVVDSTDPVGPGKVLFEMGFYRDLFAALRKDGIAIFQMGALLDFSLLVKPYAKKLQKLYPFVNPVRLPMASYSCGCEYSFLLASKKVDLRALKPSLVSKRLNSRLGKNAGQLLYYTPELHCASLVMPKMWTLDK